MLHILALPFRCFCDSVVKLKLKTFLLNVSVFHLSSQSENKKTGEYGMWFVNLANDIQ